MKRLILSVVMTGVLGLAAFSLSNAQQSGDAPRGRGPGGPGGPGGFGRGGVAVLRGVDLTDEQKASNQGDSRRATPGSDGTAG